MRSEATVVFEDVFKHFGGGAAIGRAVSIVKRLKAGRLGGAVRRPDQRAALDGVSFVVKKGERVGFLGPNGAGKSTILKLVNGVIDPTGGKIDVVGSVGGLLEVNAGFQPNLTAYENVMINLAFQGFSRAEAKAAVGKVFELAELVPFRDVTFQSLSSGMAVRLGFMAALLGQPDIVLLDEVLAVGDARFRAKCLEMIGGFLADRTTLFVSHNMQDVREVCSRVIVLHHGKVFFDGGVEDGIAAYARSLEAGVTETERYVPHSKHGTFVPADVEVDRLTISVDGAATTAVRKGDKVRCEALLRYAGEDAEAIELVVQLKKVEVGSVTSVLGTKVLRPAGAAPQLVRWEFDTEALLPGSYVFELTARAVERHRETQLVVNKFRFDVASEAADLGLGLVDLRLLLLESDA